MSEPKVLTPGTKQGRKDRIRGFTEGPAGEALAILNPKKAKLMKSEHKEGSALKPGTTFGCSTQKPVPVQLDTDSSLLRIFVGLFVSVTRWKKNSSVNFATYMNGYPGGEDDAIYAANALNEAAEEWNRKAVGVTFNWVDKLEDANFVLAYGGNLGDVVAEAYFPNQKDLNIVYVYKRGFDDDTKPELHKFFLHELGHVLGLRHEFAPELETNTGAVLWGSRNPISVMTYRDGIAPEIQDSDVTDTKTFIEFDGDKIGNQPLYTYEPDN
ncbi:uncharacterized protein A1O5_13437 [Cladophialophora psammophila CBS 110553]|uniref:Peptidase metallopeptidase domain-containing protein n=1 Tax=Cladophialophora psammophila CBS 110553 TaxID=1182543 RepID=W9VJV7_9EURO|nr:uncharacterized protein A1O5_13437 [Cladophialophora psammophila CBS 110553]EXJ53315.1 hypothetical protein A1O5_13437 [Cladophialophora psammophila CBS 110553]